MNKVVLLVYCNICLLNAGYIFGQSLDQCYAHIPRIETGLDSFRLSGPFFGFG